MISVVVLTAVVVVVVVAAVMVVVMVMVMVVAFIFIVLHLQENRMCVRENIILFEYYNKYNIENVLISQNVTGALGVKEVGPP